MRLNRLLCATAAATLGLTALAVAEPARDATLTAAAPTYEWEDGPRQSLGTEVGNPFDLAEMECHDAGYQCDDTLLKVDPGKLEISTDGEGLGRPDMDLYLHASDASGEPGKLIKASESVNADEKLTHNVTSTQYLLVRNKYFSGFNMTYKGTAVLKPNAAPAPPTAAPAPAPAPAPAALTASAAFGAAKLSAVGKTGFSVKVSCSAACKGSLALALSKADAKKLKIKGALGKASFAHEGDKVYTVKVSSAIAKKLKKAKSATVELSGTATDATGGQATKLSAKQKFKK